MFRISKRYTFEASHRLPKHEGKCRNRHGHSYKVDVVFRHSLLQDRGSETGMLIDFSTVDDIVKPIIEAVDHTHLNKNEFLRRGDEKFYPTAEQIAGRIAMFIIGRNGTHVTLESVRVWETEKCWAEWSRE